MNVWWTPRTELEGSLAADVARLRGWFREQALRERPIAWGVGSAWSFLDNHLAPFLLLNEELFRVPQALLEAGFPVAIPVELIEGGAGLISQLPRLGIRVHAMVVSRPQPSSVSEDLLDRYVAFRDPIICKQTGELGTAAVKVLLDDTDQVGLLTAGHVFPKGVGSPVEQKQRRFLGLARRVELGYVSHHVAPSGADPAWDAAVITLSKPGASAWSRPITNLLRRFEEVVPVVSYGALSGVVSNAAVLQGALVEGGAGETRWNNCWMLAPVGVLTKGDSGAAVFTRKGDFLGLFVGTSWVDRKTNLLTHYVQDAHSLQEEVLSRWKCHF